MSSFTRKQIKQFEKIRKETINKIEIFEEGVKFVDENYIVVDYKITVLRVFNTKWFRELKLAINNINLKEDIINGNKVRDSRGKVKELSKYKKQIDKIIFNEFKGSEKPTKQIDILLKEFKDQVDYLIFINIQKGFKKRDLPSDFFFLQEED